MATKRKKIFLSIAISLVLVVCYYGYALYSINKVLSKTVPRKPNNALKEIHQIDWWENSQEDLILDSFNVKWLDGKMNLFNNNILVAISIYGRVKPSEYQSYFVEKFHVSERPLFKDSTQQFDVEIQVTPILKREEDRSKYYPETTKFIVVHERLISSMHWGENKFLFRCGKFVDSLKVFQRK